MSDQGLAGETGMPDDPIPMRLPCPSCGAMHLDVGEFATKVHHTHVCQECGLVWRPAVVPTVGVAFLPGFKNDGLSQSDLAVEVKRLRAAIYDAEVAILGSGTNEGDLRLHDALTPLWAAVDTPPPGPTEQPVPRTFSEKPCRVCKRTNVVSEAFLDSHICSFCKGAFQRWYEVVQTAPPTPTAETTDE